MSIWCSWPHIGTDPTVMYGKQARGREPVEQRPERGNVLSYAHGFSNHYPDLTGSHERPAALAVAHIAPWCTPGHEDCGEDHEGYPLEAGAWLRLEVAAPQTLNFWTKDADGNPTVVYEGATILLDEEAVRSLRDDLTEWLEHPKTRPEVGVEPEAVGE